MPSPVIYLTTIYLYATWENMPNEYRPNPVELSHVELPSALMESAEKLAAHAHDVWAVGRMAQRWRYGEHRDDARKLHPCLVPYEDLPESEKDYDRRAAMEMLRVLVSLGYRIERDC